MGLRIMNINSKDFWDETFSSGRWDGVGGREQTQAFANTQTRYFKINIDFVGTIVDFGCGLGDAFPVYKNNYPAAKLTGVDFSAAAIDACRARYGGLGDFICTDHHNCPRSDIIIASNVLEHLEGDREVAKSLLSRCRDLYIIVPFREQYLISEHVRAYDRNSFDTLKPTRIKVFDSPGWSQYGLRQCWWHIYAKNLVRPLFGKTTVRRRMQIIYHFRNAAFNMLCHHD
jgi:2-polyprenyl-3-methyl-5-hydroxy-6-metoxy-1,4-benzoquinol methylase